jgi:hypothetical protein
MTTDDPFFFFFFGGMVGWTPVMMIDDGRAGAGKEGPGGLFQKWFVTRCTPTVITAAGYTIQVNRTNNV